MGLGETIKKSKGIEITQETALRFLTQTLVGRDVT